MALAVVGSGAATTGSSATTGVSASTTPNLPTGAASTHRVYVYTTSTGAVTAPPGWATSLASTALGGGTAGDLTGTRLCSVFYRDYDGSWTMPSFTTAAVAGVAPGIVAASLAFSFGAGEQFDAPVIGTGSDTTSGTGYSATTGSIADPTGAIAWLMWSWPATPGTLSALSLTASGGTFAGNTSRHGVNGTATGRDVYLATWTYPVTTGTTAAHTSNVTGTNARTGAIVVLVQTVSPAAPPVPVATGTGTWTFAGSGAGYQTPKASGTGSWVFAGSGTGRRTPKASGTGSWVFAGSGTGRRTPKSTGSGAWTFVGAGSGRRTPKASGTGTFTFAGSGAGYRTPKANGAGSWVFTGAATGYRSPRSTGAGSWAFTGDATGHTMPTAAGEGLTEWLGEAVGYMLPRADGSGEYTFVGEAVGYMMPKADGSGEWSFQGFGLGGGVNELDQITRPILGVVANATPFVGQIESSLPIEVTLVSDGETVAAFDSDGSFLALTDAAPFTASVVSDGVSSGQGDVASWAGIFVHDGVGQASFEE